MGLVTAKICQPFTVFGSEGDAQLYLTDKMVQPSFTDAVSDNTIRLELDSNGDLIGKEAFNLNPASIDYSTLEDGLYVLYRGAY